MASTSNQLSTLNGFFKEAYADKLGELIPDGGDITGITGGEFGIVFLEKAIVRMSYIGSPLFFQFDTISRNIGCIEGGSIAQQAVHFHLQLA